MFLLSRGKLLDIGEYFFKTWEINECGGMYVLLYSWEINGYSEICIFVKNRKVVSMARYVSLIQDSDICV